MPEPPTVPPDDPQQILADLKRESLRELAITIAIVMGIVGLLLGSLAWL
ncbi:MAG: hypothetical protein H6709_21465 [Kofleriaceae bacterium]|nr:hypothetical protein [Myxococcales bacterium]MCB9574654.1 hypothetical protein [Kofleriaceae bacterium]